MKTLIFLPILMVIYLVFAYFKIGMTKSWSDTYRNMPSWGRVFFSLAIWLGLAIPFAGIGFELSEGSDFQFLWFFSGALLGLVGAAPIFWQDKRSQRAHFIGAFGGTVFGFIALLVTIGGVFNWILTGAFVLFYFSQKIKKYELDNSTYLVESAAYLCVLVAFIVAIQLS